MSNKELLVFRVIFVIAALWNLTGAIPGYFDSANAFQAFFARDLNDPLMLSIYKGSWGTTILYFFGYLFVAYNPMKHTGIVVIGALGKVFFAINLLAAFSSGLATSLVLVVIIGDSLFVALFVYYLFRMVRLKNALI